MFDVTTLKIGPLPEALVSASIDFATQFSVKMHETMMPASVFFTKQGRFGTVKIPVIQDPSDKNVVSQVIRDFRRDCDAVTFVAESWIVERPVNRKDPNKEDVKKMADKMFPTGIIHDEPDRKEVVMLCIYVKSRTLILTAPIERTPDKVSLGDWEVTQDSAVDSRLAGRFID